MHSVDRGLLIPHAAFVLALAVFSVWAQTPVPLGVGAVLSGALLLRGAGELTLPNAVTFARLFMVVGALCIVWREPQQLVPFVLLALVLDGLDGWLARRRNQVTVFGALFDQETDAVLVLLLCVELVVVRGVGLWVLIAGGLRYVLVFSRLLATRPILERRSSSGRLIYCFSYLSLSAALWPLLDTASALLVPAAVGVLLFSFAPDFLAVARARG